MNEQIPVAAEFRDDATIDIHSIFKTLQGEGPFAGQRALFVRLWGCNLRCPGCDTEYTSKHVRRRPREVLDMVQNLEHWPRGGLIVLTGGEPFRQNVIPTVYELLTAGYHVQVETNGVIAPPGLAMLDHFKTFSIVCSPKTSRISHEVGARAVAFKYVVQEGSVGDDGLPLRALEHTATPHVARPRKGASVFIQPMDEQDETRNKQNMDATLLSAMTHGYTLQLQIHKYLEIE